MTDSDDYSDDMRLHRTFDDRTVEALLAGRLPADRDDLADVAHVLASVRDTAAQERTPDPSPDLAVVLVRGLEGADAERLVAATRTPAPQAKTSTWNRKKRMVGKGFAAVAAKLGALGLMAKAALAATTTAAVVVGGGAAGVLPEQANDAVRGGITQVTGFEFPEEAEAGRETAETAPHGEGSADVGVEAHDGDHGLPEGDLPPVIDGFIDGWLFGLGVAQYNTEGTPAEVPSDVPAGEGAPEQLGPQETPGSAAMADEHRPQDTPAGGPETAGEQTPEGPPAGQPEGTSVDGQETADERRPETPSRP